MKIAYIISAYKYPQQLVRLVNTLNTPSSVYLIHVDKRTDYTQYRQMASGLEHLPNVIFLKRHNCHWGDFGHVKATFQGWDYLFQHRIDFDYCFLLTGQDYPIKSNSYIETFLSNAHERDFVEYFPLPFEEWTDTPDGGLTRIKRWHLQSFGRIVYQDGHPWFGSNKWKSAIKATLYWSANMVLGERRIPGNLKPFAGSGYWCLSNNSAKLVHNFVKQNPRFYNFFKYVYVPDEIIFQTILLNSQVAQNVINDNLRCIDWSDEIYRPRVWRKHDIDTLGKSNGLIARKFDATVDSEVLDVIDRELL